ncbi:hypothetical protein ACN2XU_22955 [Primorskyibacter sp. 2E107]|uniref:hypothetical protein n=1 Tax=Primorskyibacter sp. 2E107 TaxID=3403458 RepID=UPI003AF976F7
MTQTSLSTVSEPDMAPRFGGRALPAGESWPEDTALLVLTYSKNEHFIPAARQNIDMFWPNRPELFVVTDGDLTGRDVIRGKNLSFVALLAHALDTVQTRKPQARFVYLLLEDLVPLGHVDERYMRAVEETMRERGEKYFVTLCQGSGKQRKSPRATEVFGADADRLGLHQMDPDATAYNCLVTCWWDIDHLREVVDHKLAKGQDSPWDFEQPDPMMRTPHYMAEDCWPTFRSGFLKLGTFSKHLDRPHAFPESPLLRMVLDEYRKAGTPVARFRKQLTRWDRHVRLALKGGAP